MPENAKHGPRLSFSHDFCHYDSIPIEQSPLGTHSEPSTINFDFSIPGGVTSGESSWSAEEFFSNGKILPTEIKKIPEKDGTGLYTKPIGDTKPVLEIGLTAMGDIRNTMPFHVPSEPCRPKPETNPIRNAHEIEEIEEDEERPNVNPCWGIKKRSERLNSEIGLPLLSDSPTGSNFKQTETVKLEVSSPSSSSSSSSNCNSQKPLLRKTSYGDYSNGGNGGGIKVNSFLDVIPGGSLFGLVSIIVGSGSDKNKKRLVFFHW
ncbi:Uncharacterized protein Rs2_16277 [Raphanus sativus]|uniref:Uncharacterized protein LOC108831622 n=1 Tax=Raphanus sativus TaxID=3726 RepID=A0A6J0LMR3_RAPSA|nr:uncharacterized protein LOC108831622 [Raphanus sativus]KAJ4902326.1 Uncharacterized protein Rs2_16277 [Raphanus sativus]